MNKKMSKRQRDIKTKLMAAVAMLLVSSIMMVSTTYAWFTLSTAPEVTGISTAVGANGNLEMALMPLHGDVTKITSSTSDSMASKPVKDANITWGNLVDLGAKDQAGKNVYGMDEITLYPSQLNVAGEKINTTIPLKTPVYGSDGRVSTLDDSTVTGVYTGNGFYQSATDENNQATSNPTGMRAIGTISGMTEEQKDFRSALSSANNAAAGAQTAASNALKAEGPNLAGVAIKHATADNESYSKNDLKSLLNMLDALLGTEATGDEEATEGALSMIENAMRYYLYATVITNNPSTYSDLEAKIIGENALPFVGEGDAEDLEAYFEADTALGTAITELSDTLSNAESARTGLKALYDDPAKTSYTWNGETDGIYKYLKMLADPSAMTINTIPVNDLNKVIETDDNGTPDNPDDDKTKTNMSVLINSVLSTGINLELASGSGVYADVADFCGDYSSTITIPEITYGFTVEDVPATMKTASTVKPPYLDQTETYVRDTVGAPSGGDTNTLPITDYYGYIIDLAFRTNAADSFLRLQTDAVDRIYNGNNLNDETMGGGSTMTFKSLDTTKFPNTKVVALMQHIKVIFFNPTDGTILAYAKPQGTETTDTDNNVTMKLGLYEGPEADAEAVTDLMALEQNKAHRVSVLVYLDGESVSNADVAYTGTVSMTGSLNLQFCSSATLVPMEYSDLRTGANNGDSGDDDDTTTITVSADKLSGDGTVTPTAAVFDGSKLAIQLTGATKDQTVTVTIGGGSPVDATVVETEGKLGVVVSASGVTADTTVAVVLKN